MVIATTKRAGTIVTRADLTRATIATDRAYAAWATIGGDIDG